MSHDSDMDIWIVRQHCNRVKSIGANLAGIVGDRWADPEGLVGDQVWGAPLTAGVW